METQEKIKTMDGTQGSEDGMLLDGTFYSNDQWPGIEAEIRESLTQTGAAKMLKRARPAQMTWTWKVSNTLFGGAWQYIASKTDIEISEK